MNLQDLLTAMSTDAVVKMVGLNDNAGLHMVGLIRAIKKFRGFMDDRPMVYVSILNRETGTVITVRLDSVMFSWTRSQA